MIEILLLIAALVVFLALDLIAVAARSAFSQTSHARLLALREQMDDQVNRTLQIHGLHRLRASLNLILVLARFFMAGLLVYVFSLQPLEQALLQAVVGLLISAYVVFFAEWLVDTNVSRSPDLWAVRLTPIVRIWMALAGWLLALPLAFHKETQTPGELAGTVTEDELKTLVDAGQEEGLFQQGERRMIYSIFQLGDTLAREIMVPRIDMLALDVRTPLEEAVDALLKSGHSRVPVFEETVDKTLGLLYAKDLLRVWREGDRLESLRALLRPAYFVPEAKKVDHLLAEMQSQRIHMAIVVDEYGGVAGLVTLEDIIEEVLGEIQDEYDQGEEAPYQVLMDGEYIFLGRVDVDDFNEVMGSDLPKDEAETLGGYIYSRIGRVPRIGEVVRKDNLSLTVEQVSSRRIHKIRARWLPETQEGGGRDGDTIG